MSNKSHLLIILFVGLCLTIHLFPVEVKKKEIGDFITFQKGSFSGTALDSRGGLFIGPVIDTVPGPEAEYYLSMVTAADGSVYVGTGHKASVYRVPAGAADRNAVKEVFHSNDLDVYALLLARRGDLYVATSPDGKLYKVPKNKPGTSKELFNPEEKFIWDIKEDNAGNLILATGNTGGVYRVTPEGSAAKIFSSEDTHILRLYISKTGAVLAGSGDRGILYQIDNTKTRVLFDSPFEEIRGICEDKDGNIFFSATRGLKQQNVLNNTGVETFLTKKKKEETLPPPQKSILYRRRTDGVVERVWTSYTEYIYSVCYDAENNSVLVGTGNSGRVYRVDKEGNFSIVYESEAAQVFDIAAGPGGFSMITNNTATLAAVRKSLNRSGAYFSEIYDLGIQSRLGKIYWDADTGAGSTVSLAVRTGNSNVPDATWSKWSAPFSDPENSGINVNGVRYFQVKAVLNVTSVTASPRLNRIKIYYVQSNLKPRLKKVTIKQPSKQPNPQAAKTPGKPKPTAEHLSLRWSAADPNKDKLKYNLFLQRTGSRTWIPFKEDVDKAETVLDMRLFEDGKYRLKVAADDSLSNPPGMAQTAELVSAPFVIDSTAPVVNGFSKQGQKVAFTVNDQTSPVAKVLYSYDGKLWFPVFPTDMISDSKTETFSFNLGNKKGRKYVFIKVVDEFANSKVFQKEI